MEYPLLCGIDSERRQVEKLRIALLEIRPQNRKTNDGIGEWTATARFMTETKYTPRARPIKDGPRSPYVRVSLPWQEMQAGAASHWHREMK